MNEEQVYERKAQFVQFQLSPFLAALTEGDVAGAEYRLLNGGGEAVRIAFANGYCRDVNVTGDSRKAIVLDVVGAL